MNRFTFSRADAVVFIGARMGEHARRRYGEPPRWAVLETGAELSEFSPEALAPAAPESELERWCEGRVVLSYVGNMGRMHDWETLAAAVPRVLAQARGRIGVVIAAWGPGAEVLRRAWADLPADAIRFEPPLDDRPWARLLSRTHVALVTLRDEARNTSIPSKTFSAMAAGAAVLAVAPRDSDVANLVDRHACGVVVPPGDVEAATAALLRLCDEPEHRGALRRAATAAVVGHYDMPQLAARWGTLLDDVVRARAPTLAAP
jgi:glycosyltransferase involved in cell wall biosynthesis